METQGNEGLLGGAVMESNTGLNLLDDFDQFNQTISATNNEAPVITLLTPQPPTNGNEFDDTINNEVELTTDLDANHNSEELDVEPSKHLETDQQDEGQDSSTVKLKRVGRIIFCFHIIYFIWAPELIFG